MIPILNGECLLMDTVACEVQFCFFSDTAIIIVHHAFIFAREACHQQVNSRVLTWAPSTSSYIS
jgi:hypothetical protein